jgi:multiple sugar transport system permease protein
MERERRRAAFWFLLPAVLFFGVYVVYPILDSIVLSFYDWDGMAERTFVGLGNYRELFN